MGKEMLSLQTYFAEAEPYEGHVRNQDIDEIQKLLQEEFPNVVILTNRALQKALVDVSFKNDLKEMIEKKRFKQNVIEV